MLKLKTCCKKLFNNIKDIRYVVAKIADQDLFHFFSEDEFQFLNVEICQMVKWTNRLIKITKSIESFA